jgi:hypothetical protein
MVAAKAEAELGVAGTGGAAMEGVGLAGAARRAAAMAAAMAAVAAWAAPLGPFARTARRQSYAGRVPCAHRTRYFLQVRQCRRHRTKLRLAPQRRT